MKKIILLFSISFIYVNILFGQFSNHIDFDSEEGTQQITIDTLNPDNIWQIGKPQKELLNTACSQPKAIITDTINHYPINNKSIFEIVHYKEFGLGTSLGLEFRYSIDTDSLNDYGYIEYSLDAKNWINLTDTLYQLGELESPIYTGRKDQCTIESLWLGMLVKPNTYDSILYRFIFVSDSIETNQDGWFLDNITSYDGYFSTDNINNTNPLKIFPNPTTDFIQIEQEENEALEFSLFSLNGQILLQEKLSNQISKINLPGISTGIYLYRIYDEKNKQTTSGKLLIN